MNKYILTAACGLAFSAASAQTKALPDSPNILLILVDDLGYGDLSCQGAAKDIQTPHIDKLLNEGVRFTNFHANCPVSSPSRASLLTGRYPDMVGVPGVIRTHKVIAMMIGVKREEFLVLMSIPFFKTFVLLFVWRRIFVHFCIDNFDSCPF